MKLSFKRFKNIHVFYLEKDIVIQQTSKSILLTDTKKYDYFAKLTEFGLSITTEIAILTT